MQLHKHLIHVGWFTIFMYKVFAFTVVKLMSNFSMHECKGTQWNEGIRFESILEFSRVTTNVDV